MVVTDLHGDWDAYRRYRDRFVASQAKGLADCLIFTGDLIHSDSPSQPDKSVEIVLDVIALQASYGQAIFYLCGNHELPHIYGISLAKGEREYSSTFEAALTSNGRRAEVMALFDSLPFYLRTKAGVVLTHAGGASIHADTKQAFAVFSWSHQRLFAWADQTMASQDVAALRNGYAKLNQTPYEVMARHYLAVSSPADPRYNDLLRGFLASSDPTFGQLLWPALFTRCEQEFGLADYAIFLDALLQSASIDFYPQQMLIAGHINVKGGYQLVAKRHVRLASGHHAKPPEAGQYLLFDTAQPLTEVQSLLLGLDSIYQ